MATFQFSRRTVSLDFCEAVRCELPLTEELRGKVREAASKLLDYSREAKASGNEEKDLENLCDEVLDAIDDIIGDGMADKIMELKGEYNLFDVIDVFRYVTDEISAAFRAMVGSYERTKPVVPVNRAERRRRNRG